MRQLSRRQFIVGAGLTGAGVALVGCADDGPTAEDLLAGPGAGAADGGAVDGSAGDATGGGVEAVIVGQELTFDVTQLEVVAGQELVVTFDNRDAGVPHNFHITGPGVDVATEIEVGPVVQTLTVTLTEPGEYTYICDVHPATMRGTIVVTA